MDLGLEMGTTWLLLSECLAAFECLVCNRLLQYMMKSCVGDILVESLDRG
jgi:hypothetical protein